MESAGADIFPDDFLALERISCQNSAASKKRVLEEIGQLLSAATSELTGAEIFGKLLERERLGSTGLGQGIALPHARISGIEQARGAFIQLQSGVDFDAIDNQPVDLAFGLIVPQDATGEHLKLLARLASLFSNQELCARLREARDSHLILNEILRREDVARSA